MIIQSYCSYCHQPCEVVLRDDSFDHAFGTHRVVTEHPACHPDDDILTQEEMEEEIAFQAKVLRVQHELTEARKTDIFREILGQYVKRVA